MNYRKFPRLDWQPSALGFGAMRLPVLDGDQSKVNLSEAVRIIRYAIDRGVNYLDTAYFYHGGKAEQAVACALQDGYREKIKLATKFPAREVKSPADFDRAFAAQLERLQTGKIDFYLLHGLHSPEWERLRDMGILSWLEKQVARGKLQYLGFSFHDEYPLFEKIVDAYDNWTFCQVHYNYMDIDYQAGRRGIEYAAKKGLGVIVMEPLRGGQLANPPEMVARIWDSSPQKHSPAEWALRWVWSHANISLVLSGMSTLEQVRENLEIASGAAYDRLSREEMAVIDHARQAYKSLNPVPCTGCRYCMPCPNGVEIPEIFRLYGQSKMYQDTRLAKIVYGGGFFGLKPEQKATNCIECGKCVQACPQHIDIPAWLKKAHSELTS